MISTEEFARIRQTYIENWPERLHVLSIRQIDIPLSLLEAQALGANIRNFGHWFGDCSTQLACDIADRLEVALRELPNGAFVCLDHAVARTATSLWPLFDKFRDAVDLDDVVFDVFIEEVTTSKTVDVHLLELNPFSRQTDACLFRWTRERALGGDFDGSFRYLRR